LISETPKRRRTSLLDIGVRGEAGVWVGFPGREGTHAIQTTAVQLAMKISNVRRKRFHTAILGSYDAQRSTQHVPQTSYEKRARATRKTRYNDIGFAPERFCSDPAKIRNVVDPADNLMDSFFEDFHIAPTRAQRFLR